ncbi:MAG: hypothetical protein NXI23_08025 [Bacteroidetes bacterium]|jgi:hypothetical protein|nr:hypothetical protein [Bacteroidota bacterium]MDF1867684.1 hypothetical protein [Saprospiraceae bacterium]
MKINISLSIFLLFGLIVQAQNVENIRVQPQSDKMIIYYEMPDITERYVVDVSIWCSIEGGENFQLEFVQGDVGANIRGGKSVYKVIWNKNRQVENLKNAQFFVHTKLVGMDRESELKGKGKIYIGYNGSFGFEKQSLGFRAGYFNKVGGYGALSIDPQDPGVGTITGGVTLRMFQNENTSFHGYTGAGIGDFFDEVTFEIGLVSSFYGVTIAIGGNIEFGVFESNFVAGVGYMF